MSEATMKKITPEDVKSITDIEMAFGTTRFLPPMESIPKEFVSLNSKSPYVRVANALFAGVGLPEDMEIEIMDGISPQDLNRFIRAHLCSFEPKHEHKIAGVAYLMSQLGQITEGQAETHKGDAHGV